MPRTLSQSLSKSFSKFAGKVQAKVAFTLKFGKDYTSAKYSASESITELEVIQTKKKEDKAAVGIINLADTQMGEEMRWVTELHDIRERLRSISVSTTDTATTGASVRTTRSELDVETIPQDVLNDMESYWAW